MASLMEELLDVLEKEEQQYQELIELGQQKRVAVIAADIPALEQVTASENVVASVLQNLAKRRMRVLNDMATVLGKEQSEITITKMIGYLQGQPEEQQKLIAIKEKILATSKKMTTINQQNEVLLRQALEMVEFDLTLLKSMRQAPETANYNKRAYNTGALLGGGGFDAKQ